MKGTQTSLLIIMGVSGTGKTTIGRAVAQRLGWRFYEGDEFHPAQNIAKMAQGIALQDEDRWPWLARLRDLLRDSLGRGESMVLTCSALKASYRAYLTINPAIRWVYLFGDPKLLHDRLEKRQGHYMKADMLASQLATLEEPHEALKIDVADPVDQNVERILRYAQEASNPSSLANP